MRDLCILHCLHSFLFPLSSFLPATCYLLPATSYLLALGPGGIGPLGA